MRAALVSCGLFLLLSARLSLATSPDDDVDVLDDEYITLYEQCRVDSDCATGFFCHEKLGHHFCEPCLDCPGLYFRQPGRTNCAKSPFECGVCRPGHSEERLSQGRRSDRCRLDASSPTTTVPKVKTDANGEKYVHESQFNFFVVLATTIVCVVGAVALAICMGVICWTKLVKRAATTDQRDADISRDAEALLANDARPRPPTYDQAVESAPFIFGESGNYTPSSEQQQRLNHAAKSDSEGTNSIIVTVNESRQSKNGATPFNFVSYGAHVRVSEGVPLVNEGVLGFEGEFELEVISVDRAQSPTESVHSDATEPSQWQPEHMGLADTELSRIEEVDSESEYEDLDAGAEPQGNDGEDERRHLSSRRIPCLTTDSGFLTTASESSGNSRWALTSNFSSTSFNSADFGRSLTRANQDTVRSLGAQASPVPGRCLFRTFSNVDVPFGLESVERIEASQNTSVAGDKASKKRRHPGVAEVDSQGVKSRFKLRPGLPYNSESE